MTIDTKSPRRSYREGCIVAHALDLIGDRWALLVARELMLGPKRFAGLRTGLPGLSANILARRLSELEAAGVLRRRTLPAPASVQVYELAPAGIALWPVIEALCRWGTTMTGHDPRLFISPTALMLSMRALVRTDSDLEVSAGFRLGDEVFRARMSGGLYEVARADTLDGELTFEGGANAVASVVYGPAPLRESSALRGVAFEGDPGLGQAFVDCFSLRR